MNKEKKDYVSLRIVQWGFRTILKIAGTKVTVIGKENIPDEAFIKYYENVKTRLVSHINIRHISDCEQA